MTTIDLKTDLNLLVKYITEKKEFYFFNRDDCQIDLSLLVSFSYSMRDVGVPELKLEFLTLGKQSSTINLSVESSHASTGIPFEVKSYCSIEECIVNLDAAFVNKVMSITIDYDDGKGSTIGLERIQRLYRFKKTTLEKWIKEYPGIAI